MLDIIIVSFGLNHKRFKKHPCVKTEYYLFLSGKCHEKRILKDNIEPQGALSPCSVSCCKIDLTVQVTTILLAER